MEFEKQSLMESAGDNASSGEWLEQGSSATLSSERWGWGSGPVHRSLCLMAQHLIGSNFTKQVGITSNKAEVTCPGNIKTLL